ncbi:MAG: endonuclease/exonuclease/phosphatase family protein [Muribaculaceae bacterium]
MKKILLVLALVLSIGYNAGAEEDITMMTYNIKGNSTNATKIADVAKVINYYSPDFVAVQEVHKRPYMLFHDYLEDIAKATGMKPIFFPLVSNYYGIGFLSFEDPISVQTKAFPFSDSSKDKEDRGIIIAEFPNFFFITTHYSLNADDRDTATAWIVNFAAYSDKTVFVAGDFNAQPTYRAMVTFKNHGFKILNDVSQLTIPSDNPKSCIDMVISYSNFDEAKKYDVIESGIATTPGVVLSTVSDHLPVFVNLRPKASSVNSVMEEEVSIRLVSGGVSISGLKEVSQVSIIDMSGRVIDQQIVNDNEMLSLSKSIEKGIYLILIKNRQQSLSKKLLFNN